jgi:DNA processing protein
MLWLALTRTPGVGPKKFWEVIRHLQQNQKAIVGDVPAYLKKYLSVDLAPESDIKEEAKNLSKIGGHFIFWTDENYPPLLKQIPAPPPVLSFIGNPSSLKKNALSIIGARNASLGGQKIASSLARELGEAGFAVVSGLARGIDTAAHNASLETGTLGIVAGGLGHIYPPENIPLVKEMVKQGGVLSEMPFNAPPTPNLFPRRNRIIAGISRATLVIEASLNSGSLITANYALDYNRQVFSVPGSPLDPRCQGTNKLIKEGAILLEKAEDVFAEISAFGNEVTRTDDNPKEQITKLNADLGKNHYHQKILEHLSTSPTDLEDLQTSLESIPLPHLLAVLNELSLQGLIEELPGHRFARLYG